MAYKITSAEQLEDLPDKSIVIGSHGMAYQKLQDIDAPIGLSWYSVFRTSATPQGLLEHHAPLTLVYAPDQPEPEPVYRGNNARCYSKRKSVRHKALLTAEETLYIALGPDHDTDALARRLIGELEAAGCLAIVTHHRP